MSRLWNEIVAWTFPQIEAGAWKTETRVEGGTGKVTVTLPAGAAMPQQLEAAILNQQMERDLIRLNPIAPGSWEGEFAAADPGSYLIQIMEKQDGRVTAAQTTGVTVSYSPEYAMRADGEEVLRGWLEAGGGSLLTSPAEVFSGDLPQKWETQPMEVWLLMLAALLWPVDVAVRRLQLPDQWLARLVWRRKPGLQAEAEAKQQHVLAKLRQKRDSARQDSARRDSLDRDTRHHQPGKQAQAAAISEAAAPGKQEKRDKQAQQPERDETFNRQLAAKKRKSK
jgi:hypothetical protein